MIGWGLLTTHGKMPFDLFDHCFKSWKPYCNEIFAWINHCNDFSLWKYLHNNATSILITTEGKGRAEWIREVPWDVAKLTARVPKLMKRNKVDYVVHFDEDEIAPQHPDFPKYFNEWLKSDSETMLCEWIYFWENLETIRVDRVAPTSPHSFFFKAKSDLSWRGNYCGQGKTKTNLHNLWVSPYPVGHLNKYNKKLRRFHLKHRKPDLYEIPDKERPRRWQIKPKDIVLRKWDPTITSHDLKHWRQEVYNGTLPKGCWYG